MAVGPTLSLIAVVASGCGVEGSTCRSTSDCSGDLFCRGPSEPNVCGVPPREECAASADCASGSVCHAIADGCSSDGVGSSCAPPCTATTCGAGFVCGADGACRPLRCDEGATCPAHQACGPAPTGVPVHAMSSGCKSISCTKDDDCPSATVCTNAICQSGEGTCSQDIAVP